MHIPSATYRVQLHKGFTLADLERILEYLHTLGITTIYASPITEATPGSMHGYDVTDPHKINPELGDIDQFKTLIHQLRKKDMSWLQDIVPNHMAFHTLNYRLMDILERGPLSPYYHYFDIDWDHRDSDLKGKLMVPFLGDTPGNCVSNGEIQLVFSENGFHIRYSDTSYPLSLLAYGLVKNFLPPTVEGKSIAPVITKIADAGANADWETWTNIKREFLAALWEDAQKREIIKEATTSINNDQEALKALLGQQYYRLCYWKETDSRINYRRFFTINELICLRMEDDSVFQEYHQYLFKLMRDKLIQGFRIDHIDGLHDPAKYTLSLREEAGDSCYIIAEKILEAKEEMPTQWPLQGTSGYEFLSSLNQLLTHRKGARELLAFYQELIHDIPSYQELILESKKLILENYMAGEWNNLTRLLFSLRLDGGFSAERMRQALGCFMLSLPVYRIYPDRLPLKGKNLMIVQEAFEKALKAGPDYTTEIQHLRNLFTGAHDDDMTNNAALDFLKRLMQFTGPLTAKGVEDTTFYIYNPLISHDEVGDAPAALGMSVQRFHDKMQKRKELTPLSLNATATHDTKRGEDARVRINVLSRIPSIWKEQVAQWIEINRGFRTQVGGRTAPDLNDEYFIYQSLLGGFPEDLQVTQEWIQRVQAYLNKALREAKVNTNWAEPDEQYEKACEKFVEQILTPGHGFLPSFLPFTRTVFEHAAVYSLSQTLLKLTAPGIPDIYQGCELWDLSFVDPDNRRPVDYERRGEILFQLVVHEQKGKKALFDYLREHREEGVEKLYPIWKTLNFRKSKPLLFTDGDYIPVAITGEEITALAFARNFGEAWAVVIIPLGLARHGMADAKDPATDQFVILPENAPEEWLNVLTGEACRSANQISLSEAFSTFPVALLTSSGALQQTR